MERNALILVRGVVAMAAGMLLVFGVLLAVDLLRAGHAPADPWALGPGDARNLVNILSRTCNQLMAVVFTTVAIAVPLTANMYSLKFLELFIRDRVNAVMLTLVVFLDLHAALLGWVLRDS